MTHNTTMAIKSFSTDQNEGNALEALMEYWGKSNLMHISEEMGLEFLAKLESGEICITREKCDFVEMSN